MSGKKKNCSLQRKVKKNCKLKKNNKKKLKRKNCINKAMAMNQNIST